MAKQTLTYGVSSMIGKFINVLLVPLYTSYLTSVDDFGKVTVIFTITAFLNVIYTHGMETAFFNFSRNAVGKKEEKGVFSMAFRSVAYMSLLLSGLGLILAEPMAKLLDYSSHVLVIRCMFGMLFFDALASIPFGWLRKENKAVTYVVVKLSGILVNVVLNLILIPLWSWLYHKGIVQTDPQPYFLPIIFISNVISSFFVVLLLWRYIKENVRGWKKPPPYLTMLRYALPLILVGLSGIVNETIDRLFIKFMLPPQVADFEVGMYSAFYKISLVITLFVQSFRYAAEPFFFQQSKGEDATKVYARVMDYFVWVCGIILMLTIIFQSFIARLLIRNDAYFEDERGMQIVPILLMANVFLGVYYNLSIWYKLSNRTMLGGVTAVIGAALTIVLNYWWIPLYGFVGSAWATLVVYGFLALIGFIIGKKYYPVPYHYGHLILQGIFLLGISVVCFYQRPSDIVMILLFLGYLLLFFWTQRFLIFKKG